jgi:protocatechuate 3,4-dioxygenase beta subunit
MEQGTPAELKAEVLACYTATSSPRMKEVMSSLINHLYAFVEEVELTEEEWMAGIKFLTATGQMCDDKRQEFILLSDVLGVSMLVDMVNNTKPQGATESTVMGPFYVENAPMLGVGANIAREVDGAPLLLSGRVLDTAGSPVPNALLDVWQASSLGLYDVQDPNQPEFNLRGKFVTDAEGRYSFRTARPKSYPVPTDGPAGELLRASGRHPYRPAHVHFIASAEGFNKLVMHIFDGEDEYLESDAVFAVKSSLVRDFDRHDTHDDGLDATLPLPYYTSEFDFVLTRSGEVV